MKSDKREPGPGGAGTRWTAQRRRLRCELAAGATAMLMLVLDHMRPRLLPFQRAVTTGLDSVILLVSSLLNQNLV
jgi:hypothetical protein